MWLGMLVLYLVWGSTYLAVAIAVDTIPPFLMMSARFLLAGLILPHRRSRATGARSPHRPVANGGTARSSGRS